MGYIGLDRMREHSARRVINRQFISPEGLFLLQIILTGDMGTSLSFTTPPLSTDDWENMPTLQQVGDFNCILRVMPQSVDGYVTLSYMGTHSLWITPSGAIYYEDISALLEVGEVINRAQVMVISGVTSWNGLKFIQISDHPGLPIEVAVMREDVLGAGPTVPLYTSLIIPDRAITNLVAARHLIDMSFIPHTPDVGLFTILRIYDTDHYDLRLNGHIIALETEALSQPAFYLSSRFVNAPWVLYDFASLFDMSNAFKITSAALVSAVNATITSEIMNIIAQDEIVKRELGVLGLTGTEVMVMVAGAQVIRHSVGYTNMLEDIIQPKRLLNWLRGGFDPANVAEMALAGAAGSVVGSALGGTPTLTLGQMTFTGLAAGAAMSLIMRAIDDVAFEVDHETGLGTPWDV